MEVESILEDVPHHLLPGLLGVVHKHSTIHHQVKRVHAGQSLPQVVSIYCGSNPTSCTQYKNGPLVKYLTHVQMKLYSPFKLTWQSAFYKRTYDLQPNQRMLIDNKLMSVSI